MYHNLMYMVDASTKSLSTYSPTVVKFKYEVLAFQIAEEDRYGP